MSTRPETHDDPDFPVPFPNREHHTDPCPGCGHSLGLHIDELGCSHGWTYDHDGLALTEGCDCYLALAGQHRPPKEREL